MGHLLYLVRHGEQQDAEHGVEEGPLSSRGIRQATAIADRLSGVHFHRAFHSPLERAEDTARVMKGRMPSVDFEPHSLLMDCVPTGLEAEPPVAYRSFFSGITEEEVEAGRAQMADAISTWIGRSGEQRNELLITHNFVIGWFVRHVLEAPEWKWMGLNQAHCGLTILRLRSGRPAQLVAHNDLGHLAPEDRTGLSLPQSV
ncbi:histidine phosphatase family protein [uncultured Agrococcus sp.]|uniref:histidine phosphatase family protein n=1 Tax=uncultured Agrococcus sp. TaxID=382258 RepID=UPI0025D82F0B|nr:histidine phosphatase family protein [uncultured Agrococcus sp.]